MRGALMVHGAEPPEPDVSAVRSVLQRKRPLLRILGWGSAAALALAVVAAATQTETGTERLQVALKPQPNSTEAVAAIPQPVREPEALVRETQLRLEAQQRLEAQVRALAADRDRLAARLSSLEKNLDEVTGSIKRQAQQVATPPAKPPELSAPQSQIAAAPAAPPPKVEAPIAAVAPPATEPA